MEELLKQLSYSACDCQIDYKKELGIVNGICPKHPKSFLLINGIRAEVVKKAIEKQKKLACKTSEIV